MPIVSKQRVGGLTFIRVFVLGKTFVFSFCQSVKHHAIYV